jgi:hypothetical protein
LNVRPRRFLVIEHWHIRDIIEAKKCVPARTSHVQCDGDHDAPQPRAESTRLVQIPKAPVGPEEGFLCRIFGKASVAQYSLGNGIRHRLAPAHEVAKRLEIATLRSNDQLSQAIPGFHLCLLIGKDTPTVEL